MRTIPLNVKVEPGQQKRPDIPNFLFDFPHNGTAHSRECDFDGEDPSRCLQSQDTMGSGTGEIDEKPWATQVKTEPEDVQAALMHHSFLWNDCELTESEETAHFLAKEPGSNSSSIEAEENNDAEQLLCDFTSDKEAMLYRVKAEEQDKDIQNACSTAVTVQGSTYLNQAVKDTVHTNNEAEGHSATPAAETNPGPSTSTERTSEEQQSEVSGDGLDNEVEDKGYVCEECCKVFSTGFKLKRHSYVHTGQQKYKCDKCDKKFLRAYNLKKHMRSHAGVKAFQCSVCEGLFTTKYSLNVHQRIHSGERPYQCDQCPAKFVQAGDLTVHKRMHSGEALISIQIYKAIQMGKENVHKYLSSYNFISYRRMQYGKDVNQKLVGGVN